MSTPSMSDTPRHVTITATAASAQIIVNGTEMSDGLSGYQVRQQAGQPPAIVLFPKVGTTMDFDGMATVAVASEALPGEAIAEFLHAIDPVALDAAVFDRDLDGSKHELTRAMLEQLAEWALGR